ncbi:MAG: hypothetical protein EKK46_14940 [Rhodocyclaceae bacterium]|nr:MAG: hypothetical protein EKK46_14940 [Rhodocyclaceae bacterium]
MTRTLAAALTGTCLLLGACAMSQPLVGSATPDKTSPVASTNSLQVSDLAIPPNSKLETEKSLIMGANDKWLGRIVLKTDLPPVQVYNHFYNGMAGFGWSLITTVQAQTSILTYQRGDRVALIQIEPSSLGGTAVSITVTSKQMNGQEAVKGK